MLLRSPPTLCVPAEEIMGNTLTSRKQKFFPLIHNIITWCWIYRPRWRPRLEVFLIAQEATPIRFTFASPGPFFSASISSTGPMGASRICPALAASSPAVTELTDAKIWPLHKGIYCHRRRKRNIMINNNLTMASRHGAGLIANRLVT